LLASNTTLISLDLCKNFITKIGAKALSNCLEVNSTLTKLVLSENTIDDDGTDALANGLKVNNTIKNIIINGDIPIDHLRDDTKTVLDLSSKNYKDADLVIIGVFLEINSTIKKLILDRNEIGKRGATTLVSKCFRNNSISLKKILVEYKHFFLLLKFCIFLRIFQ
jgi:Ran GTPase-activating protein (RanGAP) involved in mRNA processing and transport